MASVYGPVPLLYWQNPPPPAPPIDQGQRRGVGPRWSCWLGHSHRMTRQPDPGMDAMAFQALGLEEYSPIGAGTHNREQIVPYPRHDTLFSSGSLPTQGLGGLVQGQYITQSLLVPAELTSEPLGEANWIGLP